jgi:ABC-2 type transport system permease protein
VKSHWQLARVVCKRELSSYFSSPTGYVFITLFVFLSALAAFWQDGFFADNLANLDQLNRVFPYLLVFLIPSITMGIWAEEKRNGTDELLLTLPATDFGIVLGKYLAAAGIYTVALFFSLTHVLVLGWLGNPDPGLMASTYLGYWLMGMALLALGMVGSLLTDNITVAFILGALLCAVPVFIDHAGAVLTGGAERLVSGFSFDQQFQDLAAGVVSLSSVAYFLAFAAAMVYLNVELLGRRHWPSGRQAPSMGAHLLVRGLALVVALAGLTLLLDRLGGRVDLTAERIHSLSPDTRALIEGLDPGQPVFIQAYLSPEVPRSHLPTRNNLVNLLRELSALGGDRLQTRIVETERYTPQAREAQERFDIRPRQVPLSRQSSGTPDEIFLGIAFNCGPEEFVIPFLDPGLPVEYELMRSIRVVSRAERRRVGVLETGAKLFGGFDFQSRQHSTDWAIVAELRKQYQVERVQPGQDYPKNLDALMAVLPNTLEQDQVDRLTDYVKEGNPTLILVDPLPAFNPELSAQPMPQGPFRQGPPPRTPADLQPLMEVLGVDWDPGRIAWDKYNPHPQFRSLPPEVVFLGSGSGENPPFNPDEAITSGLQELVAIYPGSIKLAAGSRTTLIPLLQTGADSGLTDWNRLVQRSLFGVQLAANLPHQPDPDRYTLAARLAGIGPEQPVRAILITDVDLMGEQFFSIRRQGIETLQFDNVTFLLNAVDQLAGDESFIALRKRRRRHRTLEAVESRTRVYEERRLEESRQAEATANQRLQEAQARLDRAVEALRRRRDLDEQTRRIMIANQEKAENRRLAVARTNIEEEKQRLIGKSRADMESSIRDIQNAIKFLAAALPPVPAFALFLAVSVRRLRREKIGVAVDRLVE